ncbi:hypothetical protein MUK42_33307 [Musa troglodytarum]|uniref:Uncharacterized protein n=1 Tax=Musa troglodytarum TaxID=320322 RepID=A0A9E7I8J4_9LILI|nr:hypothetical protein MUK42_33307 [Musa troglodytarum]
MALRSRANEFTGQLSIPERTHELVNSELTGSVHGKSYLEESLDSDDNISSIDSSLPFTYVMAMKCLKANDVLAHPENSSLTMKMDQHALHSIQMLS